MGINYYIEQIQVDQYNVQYTRPHGNSVFVACICTTRKQAEDEVKRLHGEQRVRQKAVNREAYLLGKRYY